MYSEVVSESDKESGKTKLKEGLKGIAIIPVMYQNKPIAAINIASHTHDEIPLKARNIMENTASQIGVVVARIKAETSVRESQKNFQELFDSLISRGSG